MVNSKNSKKKVSEPKVKTAAVKTRTKTTAKAKAVKKESRSTIGKVVEAVGEFFIDVAKNAADGAIDGLNESVTTLIKGDNENTPKEKKTNKSQASDKSAAKPKASKSAAKSKVNKTKT